MQPVSLISASIADRSAVLAFLEFPGDRPVRDMQRVSSLLIGLLDGFGHKVERTCQSATRVARIETSDFVLFAGMESHRLRLELVGTSQAGDGLGHRTEALLARLVRALCPAFEPVSIHWNDTEIARGTKDWLSAFPACQPRKVALHPQSREILPRPGRGVAVWPDRPHDFVPKPRITSGGSTTISQRARYLAWNPRESQPEAENRFEPDPLPLRICSWALTATTAALCPPAGASMAVLNITKRANLRLNLHALTLTLVILSLRESGTLAGTMRGLGF